MRTMSLRQWRAVRYMSIRDLAAAADVSPKTVHQAEKGELSRMATMRKIAVGLSTDYEVVVPDQIIEFRQSARRWTQHPEPVTA